MASCSYCGSTIVFGGVNDGPHRFCNDSCHEKGAHLTVAQLVPPEEIEIRAHELHQSPCPKCNGAGPLDLYSSHHIWSALIVTTWKSTPEICCISCARKAKGVAALGSFFLGWWGFPWGIIGTPVQIVRNLWGLATDKPSLQPSDQLRNVATLSLASEIRQAQQQGILPPPLP